MQRKPLRDKRRGMREKEKGPASRAHGYEHRDTPKPPAGREAPDATAMRTRGLLGAGSRIPTRDPLYASPETQPEGTLDTDALPRRRGKRL